MRELLNFLQSGQIKTSIAIVLIYLTVSSTIGFTMFVCEEAMQVTTFAAFAYQQSEDWDGLEQHVNLVMKPVDFIAGNYIRYFGWLNPLMYSPYLEYTRANKAYIKAMEKRIERGGRSGFRK